VKADLLYLLKAFETGRTALLAILARRTNAITWKATCRRPKAEEANRLLEEAGWGHDRVDPVHERKEVGEIVAKLAAFREKSAPCRHG
jgi:hypothetical protein